MRFRIPFTFSSPEILKKKTKKFANIFARYKNKKLKEYLLNLDVNLVSSEYLGICLRTSLFAFVILLVVATSILALFGINNFYFYGFGAAFIFSCFLFFSQLNYPKIYNLKKFRQH